MIKGTPLVIAQALSPAYAKRPKLDKTDHLIVVIISRPNLSQFKEQLMFSTFKYGNMHQILYKEPNIILGTNYHIWSQILLPPLPLQSGLQLQCNKIDEIGFFVVNFSLLSRFQFQIKAQLWLKVQFL